MTQSCLSCLSNFYRSLFSSEAAGTSRFNYGPEMSEEEDDRSGVGVVTGNSSGSGENSVEKTKGDEGGEGQNVAGNLDSDKPEGKPKKNTGFFGFFRSSSDYPKKGTTHLIS